MVIGVKVTSENPYTGETRTTTKAYLTFVAMDDLGRPISVPGLIPETEDEKRRYENAKKRVELKKQLSQSIVKR
jgi:acyl-CoA hydrolase